MSPMELPKHVLSVTIPVAKHNYECVWCNAPIKAKQKYVRVVWEDHDDVMHSDHICADCWCK
jgi:hypothetical protein